MDLRRIKAQEWSLLKELRLRSLLDAPEAFGQKFDTAAAEPDSEWRSAARAAADGDRRAWFVARDDDPNATELGLVQARRRPPNDCLVFSMWVAPAARRSGVGRALIDAAAEWARGWGAQRIVLWVTGMNESALRFYERLGFRVLTDGPDAESGHAFGAFAMELVLR